MKIERKISFPERLKELRLSKGMTQFELAVKTGLGLGSLNNWETGKKAANYKAIITLADFFGVTADYLLGRTDY